MLRLTSLQPGYEVCCQQMPWRHMKKRGMRIHTRKRATRARWWIDLVLRWRRNTTMMRAFRKMFSSLQMMTWKTGLSVGLLNPFFTFFFQFWNASWNYSLNHFLYSSNRHTRVFPICSQSLKTKHLSTFYSLKEACLQFFHPKNAWEVSWRWIRIFRHGRRASANLPSKRTSESKRYWFSHRWGLIKGMVWLYVVRIFIFTISRFVKFLE